MRNKYFDIVVKKIGKYRSKVVDISILKKVIESVLADDYSDPKVYKMVYYLKNRGYLLPLKKDIYFVKSPEQIYTDEQLLDMFYWNVVKQHCKKYVFSDWYVGGIKALELNISSFDAPEEIVIVNNYKQSNEIVMFDKKIIFKQYNVDDKKLFKFFQKYTHKLYIKNNVFSVANLELSLLESFYNTPLLSLGYVEELSKKILRKYKKQLDVTIWSQILLHNKHHSSINRLYKIAQIIDPVLSDKIKDIIKRYSYFISV